MANPAPTINQINAFNATQGTTIDFNIIGGTELIRSNRIYIYDLSDNSLICTHLYVSTESIHELPPNTDGSIVYESGKSSADFVNGAQYYAQIQTYTDTAGTQGGSGLSVAKMFWCLGDPTLTVTTIPSTISTTSYNISATYTDTSASVVSNIIQQYQFNLYSATGSLLQSSGVVVGSGTQQGTSDVYDISYNFTGLNVGSSYYVTVDVTTTQGMSVNAQSGTFTVSIDTPTLGEATVVNNACDGYISVTSNLSGEYGGNGSGEIVSFETDSENVFSKLQVDLEPIQEGSGTPSPSNVRPIRGHSGVDVNVGGKNWFDSSLLKDQEGWNTFDVHLKPNTIYTMSSNLPQAKTSELAAYFIQENISPSSTTIIYAGHSFTVTTPSDGIVQIQQRRIGGTDSFQNYEWQIELGSTATPYEPYQQPQTTTQDFNVSLTPTSTDTTPYLFKAVGDVYGDRLEDKIVGGTVAWNQIMPNIPTETQSGVTITNNGDGSYTLNGTATATQAFPTVRNFKAKTGHKYLFKGISGTGLGCSVSSSSVTGSNVTPSGTQTSDTIFACVNSGDDTVNNVIVFIRVYEGATYDNLTITPQLFDLTQMFGSTIADYIYSLEQSQAGAGVAWFKKLFPNDYYEYNAGELLSVEGLQSHDTVGFNQWDEEWEVGGLTWATGQPAELTDRWRSKNFCKCLPDTNYYVNRAISIFFYDAEQNFISYNGSPIRDRIITTPINCHYFKVTDSSSTTYNHDTCINLSDPSRNGEYEPYEKHSYPLDSSLTLRGIPKLDASNNLYYDGDEYTSDGKVKRKYGVVDLGSLSWYFAEAHNCFYTYGVREYTKQSPNGVCSKYPYVGGYYDLVDKSCGYIYDNAICVRDESFNKDTTTFKAAMSGVMLVYELATPTTETATPYTNPQIVSKYGTLEYVTNSIVPVGHKTTYLTRDIFGGYVDLISGKLVVDKKYVLGDTLDWAYVSSGAYFYATTSDKEKGYNNITCNIYATAQQAGVANLQNNQIVGGMNDTAVYVKDNRYTNATTFKQAMSGTGILYELATPQTYQLTPQQVNTLVGTNNVWSEQGNIELSYHIPITNLLVKRQDVDDVSGGWLTLYSQPISQANDMDFTFIDFLNQYGKTYKYALVPLLTQTQSGVEVEVEGGYTVSNEVQSVFDGVFIADSTGSQKCKANVGYGNVDMNQVVGSITPIGAKYPIIVTNSHNQYHNGSISGTIVPDDYYFNGNLSRIDMVNKRNELEQFLTNKRVKVIKDWNGNIWLVMIAGNVSCTFNNNYGMGIVSFSTNWTEVGDPTNQQDLQATGLINVGGV